MHHVGRLAAVDEANFVIDHVGQVNVFLVAGLLAPGGFVTADGIPNMAELRAILRPRIAALPTLCRAAVTVGRRHRWIQAAPDLQHHIRLVGPVEGLAGLERVCAELMERPLEAGLPLWELLVAPGATKAGPGIVLRIHHAVADGMAAVAIVQQLFDADEPRATPARTADERIPTVISHRGSQHTAQRYRDGLHRILKTLRGGEVGPTMLLGERSSHRGVAFVHADIHTLHAGIRTRGATINDALLAAAAAGFRSALDAADERIPARLAVSVPVALQRRSTAGNQVGVMLVQLPVGEADPADRLRLIAEQTGKDKLIARDQGTLEFMRGPIGARIMDRVAGRQRLIAGFVTNVPGPDRALRLAGAPVDSLWPVAVLAGNVRLGVAAISYDGGLCCGIHFDAANVPGDAFARAMRDELRRLSA